MDLYGRHLQVLRRTSLNKTVRDVVIELSSHSKMKVLEDHYLDKELTVKGLGMKMFV